MNKKSVDREALADDPVNKAVDETAAAKDMEAAADAARSWGLVTMTKAALVEGLVTLEQDIVSGFAVRQRRFPSKQPAVNLRGALGVAIEQYLERVCGD